MKPKILTATSRILTLILFISPAFAIAGERGTAHFSGVLNDYTPASPNLKGSPWEMHGQWSMDVGTGGTADFLADMTMSDYGISAGMPDATEGGANAHTHRIRLSKVKITWDMTGCPTFSPATTSGFQLNGTVSLVTGNGSNAPFETNPPTSTLQVCVTGGSEVPYSNLSLVFGGPASTHFGPQAIHGVVRDVTF